MSSTRKPGRRRGQIPPQLQLELSAARRTAIPSIVPGPTIAELTWPHAAAAILLPVGPSKTRQPVLSTWQQHHEAAAAALARPRRDEARGG